MKKLFLFLYLIPFTTHSQNRNSVWCFGDSAGIDFSSGTANPIITSMDTRGSCVSISDTNGGLLFYASTMLNAGPDPAYSTFIYNSNHSLMPNGDSIFGKAWYHELIAIPMPGNDSLYYLFSIGVTSVYGLMYSLINVKSDSVIQKNILLQSFPMVDCITAVKHGNGRDWWLIFRRWDPFSGGPNNEFHSYLISPVGISNYTIQNIGTGNSTGGGQITFNSDGNEFVFTSWRDLIEKYDFDRCSGIISSPILIQPEGNPPPYYQITWSNAFSPNDSLLYITTSANDTNYLYQLNLTAANIYSTRINLDTFYLPPVSPGALKLAPDGKIYFSCAYDNGIQFNYPYKDSMYNYVNMNLGVINYPDSLGTACGYSPFSFYLSGKRTYYGLPNNPDYELGPLVGSVCDTITGLSPNPSPKERGAELFVFYHDGWEKLFVNAQHLKGRNCLVQIFDVNGKEVYSSAKETSTSYFTLDISLQGISKGMYLVSLATEKEKMVKKFVKE